MDSLQTSNKDKASVETTKQKVHIISVKNLLRAHPLQWPEWPYPSEGLGETTPANPKKETRE